MDKGMKFKKELIYFDEAGYNQAMQKAERKLDALENARMEAVKYCDISDLKAFEKDMVAYVTNAVIVANKRLKDLDLSDEKVLMLLDIELSRLAELSEAYYSLSENIEWNENVPFVMVEKESFQMFTDNEEQNKKWRKVKALIDAVHDLQKEHPQYIRIGAFQVATNNLCIGDIRTNSLKANVEFILNAC